MFGANRKENGQEVIETSGKPIRAWVDGVEFDENARKQVENMAGLPFVHSHVAVMPDVHVGIGATVGSVIPTIGANLAGGGRRRYRLRHDRAAHVAA